MTEQERIIRMADATTYMTSRRYTGPIEARLSLDTNEDLPLPRPDSVDSPEEIQWNVLFRNN